MLRGYFKNILNVFSFLSLSLLLRKIQLPLGGSLRAIGKLLLRSGTHEISLELTLRSLEQKYPFPQILSFSCPHNA